MEPGAWITAIMGLVGAAIGGLMSMIGSMWANRREHIRQCRVAMYTEQLPVLHGQADLIGKWSYQPQANVVDELLRTAKLATRGDAKLAQAIANAWHEAVNVAQEVRSESSLNAETGQIEFPEQKAATASANTTELQKRIDRMNGWLEGKLP